MIQIRRGVFETNSSSSHSIVIMKEPYTTADGEAFPTWRLSKDGILHLSHYHLSFGWGKDILFDPYARLCYAIASYAFEDDKIDEIRELCRKRVKGFSDFRFDHDGEGIDHGYVDHQSDGLLKYTLGKLGISLEEFIFNNRYIVIIDNDNDDTIIDAMKDTGLLNMDRIEEIVE